MNRKTKKKFVKSLIALIGIGAIFFFVVSVWATVYTFVYAHTRLVMFSSLGILTILILTKQLSWKKVKSKIIDIFT